MTMAAHITAQIMADVTTGDGLRLLLRHWPLAPSQALRGVVCLVHGLGEHIGRYEHVASHLNKCGWAVVGYDHRGHGQSPGPRGGLKQNDDLLHDLAAVIDATRAAYPGQRLVLLGHSLGGLVVSRFVSALAKPPENTAWRRDVDLCVLSSPALSIGLNAIQRALLNTVGRLTPDVAVGNGLNAQHVSNDPAVVKAYLADPLVHDRITGRLTRFMLESVETVQQRAASWATPTLLMYAGADQLVNPQGSAVFGAAAPAALVKTMPFAHMAHEILNEPDKATVLTALQNWLAAH